MRKVIKLVVVASMLAMSPSAASAGGQSWQPGFCTKNLPTTLVWVPCWAQSLFNWPQ
jgi:hypothetical protein